MRAAAPGAVVYVLNGLASGTAAAYAASDLRPVLGSPEELAEWRGFVAASGWSGGAALHVDTGMNRLGLPRRAASATSIGRCDRIALGDEPPRLRRRAAHPLNRRQIERLRARSRAFFPAFPPRLPIPPAFSCRRPSASTWSGPAMRSMAAIPTPGRPNPMAPVVTLDARILQIRTIERRRNASAMARPGRPTRRTRLAILGLGYADGFLRAGSSSRRSSAPRSRSAAACCPVVGRISMDLTAIDVTDLPDGVGRRGDLVEVIGPTIGDRRGRAPRRHDRLRGSHQPRHGATIAVSPSAR